MRGRGERYLSSCFSHTSGHATHPRTERQQMQCAVPGSETRTTMLDPTSTGRRVSNTDIWLFQEVDQIEFAIDNVSSSQPRPTMLCLQSARQFVAAPTMAASCEQEQHFLDCKSYLVAYKRNNNNALVPQTGKTS